MKGLPAHLQQRLRRLKLITRRTFRGAGAGERRARAAGASTEFRDHRAYVPGDDLRHLDWNVYARLERLHLKRFHDQQDVTTHVLLDASASMDTGRPSKLAAARDLAAALGFIALSGQDRARLHVIASDAPASSPDFAGRASLLPWTEATARVIAGGSARLDAAFAAVARGVRRPGIVIVISDLLSPGAAAGIERLAAGRHQVHAVCLLAPEDADPDADERLRGDMVLRDCETGAEVPITLSPTLRRLYRERLRAHEDELRATCRRFGAGFTRVLTTEATGDILMRHLVADGLLG